MRISELPGTENTQGCCHQIESTQTVILKKKLAPNSTWSWRKSQKTQKTPKNPERRIVRNGKHSGVLASNRVSPDGHFEKEISSKLHLVMEKIAKNTKKHQKIRIGELTGMENTKNCKLVLERPSAVILRYRTSANSR